MPDNEEMSLWLESIANTQKLIDCHDAEVTELRRRLACAMTKVDYERLCRLEKENAKLQEQVIYLHQELSGALALVAVLSAALRATYKRMVALAAIVRAVQQTY